MKKIEIADLYEYKYLSNLTYSDDGKRCVFVLSEQDRQNASPEIAPQDFLSPYRYDQILHQSFRAYVL